MEPNVDAVFTLGAFKRLTEQYSAERSAHACSACGYCPNCGRGGQWARPYYPSYPYDPYRPYRGNQPPIISYTTGTTTSYVPNPPRKL